MKLDIHEIDPNTVQAITKGGSSSKVISKLVLHAEKEKIKFESSKWSRYILILRQLNCRRIRIRYETIC
jgi:hypothetical protein